MKTISLFVIPEISTRFGYITGIIISILILGYLIYALVKPEKF